MRFDIPELVGPKWDNGRVETFDCECCDLEHINTVGPVMWEDYKAPVLCAQCIEHYGKPFELERDHAREYRRRMDVAISAAHDAHDQLKELKADMDRAFKSRDRAIAALDEITGFHQRNEKHGGCTCGKRDCPTLRALSDPWVVDRIVDYTLKESGRKRTLFRSNTDEDRRLRDRRFDVG